MLQHTKLRIQTEGCLYPATVLQFVGQVDIGEKVVANCVQALNLCFHSHL